MRILKGVLVVGCMILGTTVYAQDFNDFDTDRDSRLDQSEFNERNNLGYDDWDADRSGNIDETEFYDRID